MAQRQTKAERLLTKRPSRALHGFGNLLDRRLASRVYPQLSHVCLWPRAAFRASSSFVCHQSPSRPLDIFILFGFAPRPPEGASLAVSGAEAAVVAGVGRGSRLGDDPPRPARPAPYEIGQRVPCGPKGARHL